MRESATRAIGMYTAAVPPSCSSGLKLTRNFHSGLLVLVKDIYILSIGDVQQRVDSDAKCNTLGCSELPPRSTLFDYFSLCTSDGTLDRIHLDTEGRSSPQPREDILRLTTEIVRRFIRQRASKFSSTLSGRAAFAWRPLGLAAVADLQTISKLDPKRLGVPAPRSIRLMLRNLYS